MTAPGDEYKDIVATFRTLTRWTGENSRCCEETRDGAPKCCYQIADGADLVFSPREVEILDVTYGLGRDQFRRDNVLGLAYMLDRIQWSPERILASTNDGVLADTLECASHPTRPVVVSGKVVAVTVVKDCNTPVALERYREEMLTLRALWQRAVTLLGMKPYYVTTRLDDGLILL